MFKDQKDEMIVMLKRKAQELELQLQTAMKQVDEYKKGDSAASSKIKALEEMQASKVKTLLKSISNLKKEIQKERFEKKDNVRIKMIEMLRKEHEDFEIAINALRKVINNEDRCDQAITQELQKGPKRIRIATREELKMEIKKYKNMALRLLEMLKANGIKAPSGFKIDQSAGTGIKEDKGENDIFDINNESASAKMMQNGSNADLMFDKENVDDNNGLGYSDQELMEAKERLEEQVVKMNMEMREKNERMLELLEDIEDLKVQVYARDKSVALQQKQIEDLLEELRDSKAVENDIKILVGKKIAIDEENTRLRKQLDSKFLSQHEKQLEQTDLVLENKTLNDQVRSLQKQIQERQSDALASKKKTDADRAALQSEVEQVRKELETTRKELVANQSAAADANQRLQTTSGATKSMIETKEADIDGFRKRVIELEKEVKAKEDRMVGLEAQVIKLNAEVADKDYEIEFYSNQIEELQNEVTQLQQQMNSKLGVKKEAEQQPAATVEELATLQSELDNWKKKCKMLQQSEVTYLEEIEKLKAQKVLEERERAATSLLNKQQQQKKPEPPAQEKPVPKQPAKIPLTEPQIPKQPAKQTLPESQIPAKQESQISSKQQLPEPQIPAKLPIQEPQIPKQPAKLPVQEPQKAPANNPQPMNLLDQQQQSANRPMSNLRKQQIQMDDGIE